MCMCCFSFVRSLNIVPLNRSIGLSYFVWSVKHQTDWTSELEILRECTSRSASWISASAKVILSPMSDWERLYLIKLESCSHKLIQMIIPSHLPTYLSLSLSLPHFLHFVTWKNILETLLLLLTLETGEQSIYRSCRSFHDICNCVFFSQQLLRASVWLLWLRRNKMRLSKT